MDARYHQNAFPNAIPKSERELPEHQPSHIFHNRPGSQGTFCNLIYGLIEAFEELLAETRPLTLVPDKRILDIGFRRLREPDALQG